MTELDKFKRRLIRSVARLLYQEKKPEEEVWEEMKKETRCDCKVLWKRMRDLTIKKLNRLLAADDRSENIASAARLSLTDWLFFDMVLVHEPIDVIGRVKENKSKPDYKVMIELFSLVQRFLIEEAEGEDLAQRWSAATVYYNNQGRQCSPMLLQRRWYQLKEVTRSSFYRLWQTYRGHQKNWSMAQEQHNPSRLQTAIAKRYPHVITQPFPRWEELIEKQLVILPEEFEAHIRKKDLPKPCDANDQDLVLVEPVIETIDLGVESESENSGVREGNADNNTSISGMSIDNDDYSRLDALPSGTREEHKKRDSNSNNTTLNGSKTMGPDVDLNVSVKQEPIQEGLSNVKIMVTTHIPTAFIEDDSIENEAETSQDIQLEADLTATLKQKLVNDLLGSANKVIRENEPLVTDVDNTLVQRTQVLNKEAEDIIKEKADQYIRNATKNVVTQANEVMKNAIPSSAEVILNSDGDEDLLNYMIKQKADEYIGKSNTKDPSPRASEVTAPEASAVDSYELSADMTIIDDGIEFLDDGIEYVDEDEAVSNSTNEGKPVLKIEKPDDSEDSTDSAPKFDPKLLMDPVVYSMKLDDMKILKGKDFNSVKTKDIIERVTEESRPESKKSINAKDIEQTQEQHLQDDKEIMDNSNDYESDLEISDDQKVAMPSSLLQKPRSRSYNSIQLCKNPDFNTRLKRLTAGFFCSMRNRQLLKACNPLTIDLHKAFESKLINGTLYLKSNAGVPQPITEEKDQSETVSVVPSAMPIQSLIDSSIDIMMSHIDSLRTPSLCHVDLTKNEEISERNRAINLPDIKEVRRINQRLQTAEVPPIRIQNVNDVCEQLSSQDEQHDITLNNPNSVSNTVLESLQSEVCDKNMIPSKLLISDTEHNEDSKGIHVESEANGYRKLCTNRISKIGKLPIKYDKSKPKIIPVPVSWNKPIVTSCPLDDFLITIDTLNKMINKISGDQTSVNPQKKIKKQKGVLNSGKKSAKMDEPKMNTDANELNQAVSNIQLVTPKIVINIQDTNQNTKESKLKKGKKKNYKGKYCCWARAQIDKILGKRWRVPAHPDECVKSHCICCCRDILREQTSNKILEADARTTIHKAVRTPIGPPKNVQIPIAVSNDILVLSDDEDVDKVQHVRDSIESVVQKGTDSPTPKIRIYSGQNFNKANEPPPLTAIQPKRSTNDYVTKDDPGATSSCTHALNTNCTTDCLGRGLHLSYGSITSMAPLTTTANVETTSDISTPHPPPLIMSVPNKVAIPSLTQPSQAGDDNQTVVNTVELPLLHTKTIAPAPQKSKEDVVTHQLKRSLDSPYREMVIDGSKTCPIPRTLIPENKQGNKKNLDKVLFLNISKKPSESPIYLGKNKILLTTVKFPPNFARNVTEITNDNVHLPKVIPTLPLPNGVQLVLLPTGELTYTVEPGVELNDAELSILPSILSAVREQINPKLMVPTISQDEIIKLSDDDSLPNTYIDKNSSEATLDQARDTNLIERPQTMGILDDSQEKTTISAEDRQQVLDHNTCNTNIHDLKQNNKETAESTPNEYEKQIDSNFTESVMNSESCLANNPSNVEENSLNKSSSDDVIDCTELNKTETTHEELQNISNKDNRPADGTAATNTSRNLLSDLMEMSGISAEDTHTPLDSALPTPEVGNILHNTVSSSNVTIPELTPITSLAELKYACKQDGKFFKLDFDTGMLVSINVCIKKNTKSECLKAGSVSTTIDLTEGDDEENEVQQDINSYKITLSKPQQQNEMIIESSSSNDLPSKDVYGYKIIRSHDGEAPIRIALYKDQLNRAQDNVKPIKLFRSVHTKPTIISKRSSNNSKNQYITSDKSLRGNRKRKQLLNQIEARIDLVESDEPMEEEYLLENFDSDNERQSQNENKVDNSFDDSSDDEPLANKVKRKKGNEENVEKRINETGKIAVAEFAIEDNPEGATSEICAENIAEIEMGTTLKEKDAQNEYAMKIMKIDSVPTLFFSNVGEDSQDDDDCILGF